MQYAAPWLRTDTKTFMNASAVLQDMVLHLSLALESALETSCHCDHCSITEGLGGFPNSGSLKESLAPCDNFNESVKLNALDDSKVHATLLRHSQRIVDICPMHDGPSKGLQTILASAKFWAGQNVYERLK